jgi:hypothetical protein
MRVYTDFRGWREEKRKISDIAKFDGMCFSYLCVMGVFPKGVQGVEGVPVLPLLRMASIFSSSSSAKNK